MSFPLVRAAVTEHVHVVLRHPREQWRATSTARPSGVVLKYFLPPTLR